MVNKEAHSDDEITLIDFINVLAKWKYKILIFTFLCGILTAIINMVLPKIYCVELVFKPGVLSIDADGKRTNVDSASNIAAILNAEAFSNEVQQSYNKESGLKNKMLKYNVSIPDGSDTIKIILETSDPNEGINILALFKKLLVTKYANVRSNYINILNSNINRLKNEILLIEKDKQTLDKEIKSGLSYMANINHRIEMNQKYSESLIHEKESLIDQEDIDRTGITALFVSNLFQHNLELANSYNHIQEGVESNIADKRREMQTFSREIEVLKEQISVLMKRRDNFTVIEEIQPAMYSEIPVKPKPIRNVLIATFGALFLGILLSFFLESLRNQVTINR